MMRQPGVIPHHVYVLLIDHVTAEVFVKIYAALQGHAKLLALVIGGETLRGRMHLVHVLPAAAIVGLEEGRKAYILEDSVPIERILQVTHGAIGRTWGIVLVWQQSGRGYRDS